MRIHVVTFTHNERLLVPFFLRHYGPHLGVERIVVFDNESDDGTPALLAADPRVEVRHLAGGYSIDRITSLRNHAWKESRGRADWALIVDFDEFVEWRWPSLPALLAEAARHGQFVLAGRGRQMVAEGFPVDDGRTPLTELVRRGVAAPMYFKPCLLYLPEVAEFRCGPGQHQAEPLGFDGRPLPPYHWPLLLHYRYLGLAYHVERARLALTRASARDMASGHHGHINKPEAKLRAEFDALRAQAVDVFEQVEAMRAQLPVFSGAAPATT